MTIDANRILAVQKTQRTLAIGVHRLDPAELVNRASWTLAAQYLSRRWFPRSQDLAIAELIHQSYLYALYWYPILQQRCPGTYRPSWFQGTLLSWFRRAVTRRSKQWFFSTQSIDTEASSAAAFEHARQLPGVRNHDWMVECFDFLEGLTAVGGRKSAIAQYLMETLAFMDIDRRFDEAFHWSELPAERRKRRATGQGTASYLRSGRTVYLLADADSMKHYDADYWIDLREEQGRVGDYRIAYEIDRKNGWEGLSVYLRNEMVADARAAIKAIISGGGNPHFQIRKLRQFLVQFEAQHRYASGAWKDFLGLTRYAKSQAKRHLKARLPKDSDKSLPQIRTTNTLIIPPPNPFMEMQAVDAWGRMFSPYR